MDRNAAAAFRSNSRVGRSPAQPVSTHDELSTPRVDAKAEKARQQTVDMAARALTLAVTADKAEAYDLAASLRAAAADRAVETLKYFMSEIDATLRRRRPDDQGARTLDNG